MKRGINQLIMKNNLEIIIFKENEVYRQTFDLGFVSPEEFDVAKHQGKVFMWTLEEGATEPTRNSVYVWKTCGPETDEERIKLKGMGKYYSSFTIKGADAKSDQ